MQVRSLASISGLGIRRCCELWYRSQTQLGSQVAVPVVWAGSYSSDSTPSLGSSICRRCGPQKPKKKKIGALARSPVSPLPGDLDEADL